MILLNGRSKQPLNVDPQPVQARFSFASCLALLEKYLARLTGRSQDGRLGKSLGLVLRVHQRSCYRIDAIVEEDEPAVVGQKLGSNE